MFDAFGGALACGSAMAKVFATDWANIAAHSH